MDISRKIIAAFLLTILIPGVLTGQSYYSRARMYPLPVTTVERLGESALNIARQRLAKDKKDAKGLLLLNFANHLIPGDREVLLIRGKLKFNVPLNVPKRKTDEKEFMLLLTQSRDHINDSDTAINRHFLAVLNQLIRTFDPQEEDAIIALTEFADKGVEIDINKLLGLKLEDISDIKFDPKDPRYAVSDMSKTIRVPANVPWTDTLIKVKAGKMINVVAHGTWSMGDKMDFPACDASGYVSYDIKTLKRWSSESKTVPDKKKKTPVSSLKAKRTGAPGCLLARIGEKEYYVGAQATFKAESSGILYFGPYEWGDYFDNYGNLTLNIKVYD